MYSYVTNSSWISFPVRSRCSFPIQLETWAFSYLLLSKIVQKYTVTDSQNRKSLTRKSRNEKTGNRDMSCIHSRGITASISFIWHEAETFDLTITRLPQTVLFKRQEKTRKDEKRQDKTTQNKAGSLWILWEVSLSLCDSNNRNRSSQHTDVNTDI